jgi:hypothetical protein
MATIRQLSINHNGLILSIDVTYFVPARAMPIASTPDCLGYDDEGSPGEVEYDVDWFEVDCVRTFIESGGISFEDNDELTEKVFQEMSS